MSRTFSGPLPENIRRRMAPETRKALHCPTQPEADAKQERIAERKMHEQFESWLRRNEIPYVHSRMDKKSTIREGWPDFSVHRKGASCFIEFKVPGKVPEPEQWKCIHELMDNDFPVLVAYSYADAVNFAAAALGMGTLQDASDPRSATVYPDGNKNAS